MMRTAAAALIGLAVVSTGAGQDSPFGRGSRKHGNSAKPRAGRISGSAASQIRQGYFEYLRAGSEEQKEKILDRLAKFESQNLRGLEEAFRQGPGGYRRYTQTTLKRQCGYSPAPYKKQYVVHLPPGYDPSRPWPLMFTLWTDGEAYFRQDWAAVARSAGYIFVAPSVDKGDIGWANDRYGEKVLFTLIDEMKRDFHIDPNRIYLAGRSAGGYGVWIHGMENADRFAGIAPFMAAPSDPAPVAENLLNLPVWFGYSDTDPRTPPSLPILKELQKPKYDAVVRNFKGGHLAPIGNAPNEVIRFFNKRPRKVYPKHVVWVPFDQKHSRAYWIEILTGGGYRTTRIEAEVKGPSEIHIDARGASRVRLYLHDTLVDLDEPIKVVANGKVVFEEKVKRSIRFLFEHLRATNDRGRVFTAAIEVDIP